MPRWIEWIHAEQEYGTTIPVVPRIDRPPTMPSRPLSVFAASASPPGMEISTSASAAWPTASGDFGDGVADHAPRHRIDRRLAGWNGKTGPRHHADAFAGAKRYAGPGSARAHRRHDQRPMSDVGIVAGILDHPGRCGISFLPRQRQHEAWTFAARQRHLDGVWELPGEQSGKRRLCRRRGTGAGGPTPAQWPFLPLHAPTFSPGYRHRHHRSARR